MTMTKVQATQTYFHCLQLLFVLLLQVLALFANGRIEEWLDCITLTPEDMCSTQYVPRIARQLRKFHQIQLDLPNKEPSTPWAVIANWIRQAKQLKFKDSKKQVCVCRLVEFLGLIRQALQPTVYSKYRLRMYG